MDTAHACSFSRSTRTRTLGSICRPSPTKGVREVRAFSAGGRESSLKEKEPSGTSGPDLPHAMGYGLMPLAISGVGSPAGGRHPPVRQEPDASLRASPPLLRSAHRSRGHRPTHADHPLLADRHEPLRQSTRHRDPVSLSSATPGSQGLARPSGDEWHHLIPKRQLCQGFSFCQIPSRQRVGGREARRTSRVGQPRGRAARAALRNRPTSGGVWRAAGRALNLSG